MPYAFAVLLVLHGLIHGLGVAKAFGLAPVAAISQPISRVAGLGWGIAGVGFVAGAALLVADVPLWWAPVALAALVSQAVIAAAWADARYGTLVNLVVAVPVAFALAAVRPDGTRATWAREVAAAETAARTRPGLVTEADLAALPGPLQRYLRAAGAVGRPHVGGFRARMRGEFRQGPDSPWMAMTVSQVNVVDPPARLFYMRASRAGVPFHALHRFVGDHATFRVRVLDVYPVIDAGGPWADQSETVTVFNDLCVLAPAALLDVDARWEPIDDTHVRGTYTRGAHTVSATLTFNDVGELIDWTSDDRFRATSDADKVLQRWSTPMSDYADFGGVRLARRAEARWADPAGEFAYGRFELLGITYTP